MEDGRPRPSFFRVTSSSLRFALQSARIGFRPEATMPVYDYICNDCHKEFEVVLTLTEHDKDKIACPKCRSKNVEQEAAAFFAVTSRKS